jgi:hypothetical protein
MTTAKNRFYELGPGWPGGSRVPIASDGWSGSLTTSKSFEYMEARYAKKIASSGRLKSKPRIIPDLMDNGSGAPIPTSSIKSVLEAIAPGETEFRPFALHWQDGTPVLGEDRYLCNILNRVDCFDFAHLGITPPQPIIMSPSGEPLTPEDSWLREAYVNKLVPRPNYIDPGKVVGFHIWRPRWCAKRIFITGELLKALRDAGVKGLHVDRLFTREDA